MKKNENEKFEADMRHVQELLDQTKAGLADFLTEFESLKPALTGEAAAGHAATAPFVERNAFGWLRFRPNKP